MPSDCPYCNNTNRRYLDLPGCNGKVRCDHKPMEPEAEPKIDRKTAPTSEKEKE
jgi:hypothetical protein